MTEELEILFEITALLDNAGIAYMLSGSMALNYYAEPRMTRDIDFVVEMLPSNAQRVATALESAYYVDIDAINEAIVKQRIFNAIHKHKMIKVDFIIRKDDIYRRIEFARKRHVNFEGKMLWLATAEDLILSKLFWARDTHSEQQLKDVRNVIASTTVDHAYLDQWAAHLGVAALLAEVRK